MRHLFGVFLRGLAMGAADVVPGVSGGTVALITGIYEELIDSLAGIRPRLLGVWRREGFVAFWRAGNFTFLLALFAGVFLSLWLLAGAITWLLEQYPVPVWAFFCGLIMASIWLVLRPVALSVQTAAAGLTGALIAAVIAIQPGLSSLGDTPWIFFVSGAIAICAMILPGISGSFILLLLGMYAAVLTALDQGDWLRVGAFLLGTVCGLLAFVQLLRYLLHRWHDLMMALLAGFMAGSLIKIWPWRIERDLSLVERNVLPAVYEQATGQAALVGPALLAALTGLLLVWLLSRASNVHNEAIPEDSRR
jgi:putative membrane protein